MPTASRSSVLATLAQHRCSFALSLTWKFEQKMYSNQKLADEHVQLNMQSHLRHCFESLSFILCYPGIIGRALFGDCVGGANSNKTFPTLIVRMLPPGMVGLLVAATLAAAMSRIDSVATAGASLFCLDIYKPFIAPQASEQQLVAVGRIVIAVMSRDANSGGPGEPPCPLGLTIS